MVKLFCLLLVLWCWKGDAFSSTSITSTEISSLRMPASPWHRGQYTMKIHKHDTGKTSTTKTEVVKQSSKTVVLNADYSSAIRDLRKANAPKKIVQYVQDYTTQYPEVMYNLNMTMIAIKALQACNRSDLILPIFEIWQNKTLFQEDLWSQNVTTIWLVKLFCKLNHANIAENLIKQVEITMPKMEEGKNASVKAFLEDLYQNMAFGLASDNQYDSCIQYLTNMRANQMVIDLDISKKLLKLFLKGSTSALIRRAVYLMCKLQGLTDIDSLQMLLGSYIKTVDFIKGAVSIDTLPEEDYPEVTFIGRSNVGKSSLINMVTNRKNLAFTSKMAGKTTELNYFIAKGVVGAKKEEIRFNLVDVPGVGYAQRSKTQKAAWKELFEAFLQQRKTLQCVFHLIDSRHGILDADYECLDLLRVLPSHVNYIFVFTKLDKYKNIDFVKAPINMDIMNKINEEVQLRTTRKIPMIYTSSETRLGGVELLLTILNACK